MTSTNAKDENEMFKGEIRGADSAEGRYEKHEGKSEGEKIRDYQRKQKAQELRRKSKGKEAK